MRDNLSIGTISFLVGLQTTRRKVLKVAKMKDANYGRKDEGNDDGVSGLMTN